jgi:NLI interacting factor-like phosphatase
MNSTKEILVLDNDECLGNFATASLMMTMFIHYVIHEFSPPRGNLPLDEYYSNMVSPYMDTFVRYLEKGIARPYLKEFIQHIYQLKLQGKIKKVVMYTAATNRYGWVTFLSKLIPTYAGVPLDFYDIILSRKDTLFRRNMYFKNLFQIHDDTSKIVMIDDSPQCIMHLNATIIPVSKYSQHVHLLDHDFMDHIKETYHPIIFNGIEEDDNNYIQSDIDFSNDCELIEIMNQLDQLFR